MNQGKWIDKWSTPQHLSKKKEIFNNIDKFIKFKPKRILDIGCGLARESELFQKKYSSELYLLDGDFGTTSDVERQVNYGTVDNFSFYNKIETLKDSYDSRNMLYTFVDANNIDIPDDITFDLIISNLSCGFHYPASTYKSLVKKHSTDNTVIIFDLRNNISQEGVDILELVSTERKHVKASIKFI